jgi:hypothetical protein
MLNNSKVHVILFGLKFVYSLIRPKIIIIKKIMKWKISSPRISMILQYCMIKKDKFSRSMFFSFAKVNKYYRCKFFIPVCTSKSDCDGLPHCHGDATHGHGGSHGHEWHCLDGVCRCAGFHP